MGGKKMDVLDLIKDAFYYPINDYKNWLIIAILFLLNTVLSSYVISKGGAVGIIGSIISLLITIIIAGVTVAVMRNTFNNSNNVPMIDLQINFVDGIKYSIISIVYSVIPVIIALIMGIFTGIYSTIDKILTTVVQSSVATNATPDVIIQAIPQDLLVSFGMNILIIMFVFIILSIIAAILLAIAEARFAETGNILSAFDIKAIFDKISSIGWGNYIVFLISLAIVLIVLGIVSGIIAYIPYIGALISGFVIDSFLVLFIARAIALIYQQGY